MDRTRVGLDDEMTLPQAQGKQPSRLDLNSISMNSQSSGYESIGQEEPQSNGNFQSESDGEGPLESHLESSNKRASESEEDGDGSGVILPPSEDPSSDRTSASSVDSKYIGNSCDDVSRDVPAGTETSNNPSTQTPGVHPSNPDAKTEMTPCAAFSRCSLPDISCSHALSVGSKRRFLSSPSSFRHSNEEKSSAPTTHLMTDASAPSPQNTGVSDAGLPLAAFINLATNDSGSGDYSDTRVTFLGFAEEGCTSTDSCEESESVS